jgi:hypothetical protein
LSADFEFGQQYQLVFDKGRQIYFVDGPDGRSVAAVPIGFGGKASTRTDTWLIKPERHKRGWEIVARDLDEELAGGISEGLLPYTFKLRIGDDHDYRVTESPIDGHWTISHGHSHLARISVARSFARGQPPKEPRGVSAGMVSPFTSPNRRPRSRSVTAGEITTADRARESPPVALATLLTLEMIKAEAGMPAITADDGSGYSI